MQQCRPLCCGCWRSIERGTPCAGSCAGARKVSRLLHVASSAASRDIVSTDWCFTRLQVSTLRTHAASSRSNRLVMPGLVGGWVFFVVCDGAGSWHDRWLVFAARLCNTTSDSFLMHGAPKCTVHDTHQRCAASSMAVCVPCSPGDPALSLWLLVCVYAHIVWVWSASLWLLVYVCAHFRVVGVARLLVVCVCDSGPSSLGV